MSGGAAPQSFKGQQSLKGFYLTTCQFAVTWNDFYSPCSLILHANPNPNPNQYPKSYPNHNPIPNPNPTEKWRLFSRLAEHWSRLTRPPKSSFSPITSRGCIFTMRHEGQGWFGMSVKNTSAQVFKYPKCSNIRISENSSANDCVMGHEIGSAKCGDEWVTISL